MPSAPSTRARAAGLLTGALTAVLVVSGCGGGESTPGTGGGTPSPTRVPSATAAKPKAPATASRTPSAPPTTSTLGPFPPVLSSGPSRVPATSIRGPADLPGAFQCPATPAPIPMPASGSAPAAIVCTSMLAGEALFLWYVDTPDARYLALQAALARAAYVRGGPTWVAGGMIDPRMGGVGGDVYK